MVHIANIVAVFAAGSSVVSATANTQQLQSAVDSYAGLMSNLANNVGKTGSIPSEVVIKDGLDTFVNLMQSMKMLQMPAVDNSSAMNWEGAAIGGIISAQFGLISGALLGSQTTWTFDGLERGLTNALGFDPIAAIMGTPPMTPAPAPGTAPAPKPASAPAPAKAAPPAPGKGMGAGMGGMSHGGHGGR